jgi:hypothetical protein
LQPLLVVLLQLLLSSSSSSSLSSDFEGEVEGRKLLHVNVIWTVSNSLLTSLWLYWLDFCCLLKNKKKKKKEISQPQVRTKSRLTASIETRSWVKSRKKHQKETRLILTRSSLTCLVPLES